MGMLISFRDDGLDELILKLTQNADFVLDCVDRFAFNNKNKKTYIVRMCDVDQRAQVRWF